jgi:thiol-disulfide isomerase/thioredoxin
MRLLYLPAHRMKYLLALLIGLVLFEGGVHGQATSGLRYPKLGRAIPDYQFSDVQYFNRDTVSIREFRGKWLVLDFWTRFCVSCVADMPDLGRIQKEMGGCVQVLLVGLNYPRTWSAEEKAHPGHSGDYFFRTLYKQIRERDSIDIPIAWDTMLFKRFQGQSVPYTIIVNPSGLVEVMTSGITKSQLEAIMKGGRPSMYRYVLDTEQAGKRRYNIELPYLTNGVEANGGSDTAFMFRDILSGADPEALELQGFRFRGGTFDISDESLVDLYEIAFIGALVWDYTDTMRYGKFWPNPIVEVADSAHQTALAARYSYSLTLYKTAERRFSHGSQEDLKKLEGILQRDLALNFPYKVELIDTMVSVYDLIVTDSAKAKGLSSKGGSERFALAPGQIDVVNVPIAEFAGRILSRTRQFYVYVENRSGIIGNIDFSVDGLTGEVEHVNAALAKVGLRLEPERKLVKAVVITDGK